MPELPALSFDERLCIVWLLLQRLMKMGEAFDSQEKLSDSLKYFAGGLDAGAEDMEKLVQERLNSRKKGLKVRKENGLLSPDEEERERRLSRIVRECMDEAKLTDRQPDFSEKSREEEQKTAAQRQALVLGMQNAADFIRRAFGEKQEMVVFLTGLTEHPVCRRVLKDKLPQLWTGAEQLLSADEREARLRARLAR